MPGGGSASAIVGALAAALLVMVARLTRGRERYAAFEETAAEVEAAADRLRVELLELADLDAAAYGAFLAARRMPRASPTELAERQLAVEQTSREAVHVPLRTARAAAEACVLAVRLAGASNPNAASDVGAAAHLAAAAARAAILNVRINLPTLADDDPLRDKAGAEVDRLIAATERDERAAAELVETALG